jgi:hypothetical protein
VLLTEDMKAEVQVMGLRAETDRGEMLPNMFHLPHASKTVTVEIKPKCGFHPSAETIHPCNSLKKVRSRYQLHQELKVAEVRLCC